MTTTAAYNTLHAEMEAAFRDYALRYNIASVFDPDRFKLVTLIFKAGYMAALQEHLAPQVIPTGSYSLDPAAERETVMRIAE